MCKKRFLKRFGGICKFYQIFYALFLTGFNWKAIDDAKESKKASKYEQVAYYTANDWLMIEDWSMVKLVQLTRTFLPVS